MQVARIIIEGRICRDMYDEHPGFAYFYTDGQQQPLHIPRALPLVAAQAFAEAAWRHRQAGAEDDDFEEYDGQFTPIRILLLARDRTVLQCFEHERWVTEFDAPEQWAAMLEQARELASEASVEAGWDNFSTAEGLRAEAEAIRWRVAIARAHFAAQPGANRSSIRGLDERIALALSRIARISGSSQAEQARIMAMSAADTLGFCEYRQGIETPPLMFKGEPDLLSAWQAGQRFAAGLVELSQCPQCQDPEQAGCTVHG